MFYKSVEETEALLDFDNFTKDTVWCEFIKSQVDETLYNIKRLVKLKNVQFDNQKIRKIIKSLTKCRNEILDITECFKSFGNDINSESEESENEQQTT